MEGFYVRGRAFREGVLSHENETKTINVPLMHQNDD